MPLQAEEPTRCELWQTVRSQGLNHSSGLQKTSHILTKARVGYLRWYSEGRNCHYIEDQIHLLNSWISLFYSTYVKV